PKTDPPNRGRYIELLNDPHHYTSTIPMTIKPRYRESNEIAGFDGGQHHHRPIRQTLKTGGKERIAPDGFRVPSGIDLVQIVRHQTAHGRQLIYGEGLDIRHLILHRAWPTSERC